MSRTFITEWWNVLASRHFLYYCPVYCVALLCALTAVLMKKNYKTMHFAKILLLVVTMYLGFRYVKLLSLLLIVIASLYYTEIIRIFNKNGLRFLNKLAFVCICVSILFLPLVKPAEAKLKFSKLPIKEVEFIKINNIKGNLLPSFGTGSYVSYKLYPHNLIYMDGRYEEVYNNEEFDNLMHYELVDEKWDNVLKFYKTDILMPEKNTNVYPFLKKNKDWVVIYEGETAAIFIRKNLAKKSYKIPTDDLNYYQVTAFEKFK
jgi:hypothetical protein